MRRKASKSATKVRLKVQTHVWDHQAAGSNPVTPTIFFCVLGLLFL